MPKTYYFISDLHIGGDEALGVCDYEAEFIGFLQQLAASGEEAELIIIGDIFGLWEFTEMKGLAKLDKLLEQFPGIFQALQQAGEKITITMLPGNHDYEIACYDEYVTRLAAYNVSLAQTPFITRELAGRKLWIEHGNQYDLYNRVPDFGNLYAQPIGYFLTSNMVSTAGRHSRFGRYNWLKDIQSVYPTEQVPYWIFSNYFYHEMSLFLRWLLLPFLLFTGLEVFVLAGAALEFFGVTQTNIFLNNRLLASLGYVGNLVQLILMINTVLLVNFLVLATPLYFIWRDFRATLRRFRLVVNPADLSSEKEQKYLDAAQRIFREHPEVLVFIYGHTHKPSLRHLQDRYVINTGTWLKRLNDVPPRFGLLPRIYVPFFCLNYFRLQEQNGHIIIDYRIIPKEPPQDLSLLQRLLVPRRKRYLKEDVPTHTVVPVGWKSEVRDT